MATIQTYLPMALRYLGEADGAEDCGCGDADVDSLGHFTFIFVVEIHEHDEIELSEEIVREVVEQVEIGVVFFVKTSHQHVLFEVELGSRIVKVHEVFD